MKIKISNPQHFLNLKKKYMYGFYELSNRDRGVKILDSLILI